MTIEYRIVRTDERWDEEVRGPVPDLEMQRAHLADLCDFYPRRTFRIEKRVAPSEWEVLDV